MCLPLKKYTFFFHSKTLSILSGIPVHESLIFFGYPGSTSLRHGLYLQ